MGIQSKHHLKKIRMPHRYIGDRPPVKVNYTYGAGGSISSGQRDEEPVWVPIEIQKEGRNIGLERKSQIITSREPTEWTALAQEVPYHQPKSIISMKHQ